MHQITRWPLKLILAAFAAAVSGIAIVLPYESRKSYIQFWLRFKHAVSVIF